MYVLLIQCVYEKEFKANLFSQAPEQITVTKYNNKKKVIICQEKIADPLTREDKEVFIDI